MDSHSTCTTCGSLVAYEYQARHNLVHATTDALVKLATKRFRRVEAGIGAALVLAVGGVTQSIIALIQH